MCDDFNPLKQRCIIRLSTSAWRDKRGIYLKKEIRYMRKLCTGYNTLEEEADSIGLIEAIQRIVNLDKCSDGIYEVLVCNESRDWETGYTDDYDLQLAPFNPEV